MYKPLLRSSLHQRQSQFVRCQSALTNRPRAIQVASKERKEFNLSNCSEHSCIQWVFCSPHMETDGNALVCLSASGNHLKQNIKKRKKRKGKWKVSKLNRLRGSSNLQSVTWTLVLKLDIFLSVLAFILLILVVTFFPLSKTMTEGKHRAEEH